MVVVVAAAFTTFELCTSRLTYTNAHVHRSTTTNVDVATCTRTHTSAPRTKDVNKPPLTDKLATKTRRRTTQKFGRRSEEGWRDRPRGDECEMWRCGERRVQLTTWKNVAGINAVRVWRCHRSARAIRRRGFFFSFFVFLFRFCAILFSQFVFPFALSFASHPPIHVQSVVHLVLSLVVPRPLLQFICFVFDSLRRFAHFAPRLIIQETTYCTRPLSHSPSFLSRVITCLLFTRCGIYEEQRSHISLSFYPSRRSSVLFFFRQSKYRHRHVDPFSLVSQVCSGQRAVAGVAARETWNN